jgi:phage shock protein C
MEEQKLSTEPRRLYRSKVDRIFAGVCSGFADYFSIDPTIVRVLWLVITFLSGIWTGILAYLACLIIMKDNPHQNYADKKPQSTALYWGIAIILIGLSLLPFRWGWEPFHYRLFHWHLFRPWFTNWDRFWPVLVILFGVIYLVYALRQNKNPETRTETKDNPNRLFRSRDEKIIAGVCGGIGKNLNVDPVIIRIGWVVFSLLTALFLGIAVYIIWIIIVPEEPFAPRQEAFVTQPEEKPVKKVTRRVKKLPDKEEGME